VLEDIGLKIYVDKLKNRILTDMSDVNKVFSVG